MFVQDQCTMSLSPSLIDYIASIRKNNGEREREKKILEAIVRYSIWEIRKSERKKGRGYYALMHWAVHIGSDQYVNKL